MFTLGIIGLGAMGARMALAATDHPDFVIRWGADLSDDLVEEARGRFPQAAFTTDPYAVIGSDVDAVYIATPPATHADLAVAALTAGKATFCEKPLAVSAADGQRMLEAAQHTGLPNAVNFALSDRAATMEVARALASGQVGTVRAVDIRVGFPVWPRAFQAHAAWLDGREQGGFVREVVSHFVYLTDKLLGPVRPDHARVEYAEPDRSEVYAVGSLSAGDVPVQVIGVADVAGPEFNDWTLWGQKRSYRLSNWGSLAVWDGGAWAEVALSGPLGSEVTRLSRFAEAMRGTPQPDLADFAAALRVQTVIESFHRR